jgi:hypothetical protein
MAGQAGNYCVDAKTVATCSAQGACFVSSNPTKCAGVKTCQGQAGLSVCQCPAPAAMPGGGCATAGATACGGTVVLTCVADPGGSGCNVWMAGTDCAAAQGGPFVCGTKSGAAACQCPEPTGDVYADPVAGSDAAAGMFPSGAQTPAACRFKTLTRALQAATAAGMRVVATTAAPPATFSGEKFPLAVPAGVTLTTGDATPTPANYTIAFASAVPTPAVTLAAGATIQGFSVAGDGGSGSAAIACNSGAVTIKGVALAGAATGGASARTGLGISVVGACSASIANVTADAFGQGIGVATTSTVPVTLTDVTVRDCGTGTAGAGLRIGSGTVTATRLTIARTANGVAATGVVLDPLSPTAPAVLNATTLNVVDVAGIGLDVRASGGMAPPQVMLTGGDIKAATTAVPVVQVAGGTVTLSGTNVHGGAADGLDVSGGMVTASAGAHFDGNGEEGVNVTGGTVVMHGVTVSNNVHRGLFLQAGSLTFDDGSVSRGNGTGTTKSSGLRILAGTLTVGGAGGALVELADNGLHGLKIEGPGGAGTVINASHVSMHGNGSDGIQVDLESAAAVNISDADVYGNGEAGVLINRVPAGAAGSFVLDNTRLYMNGTATAGGFGLWIAADAGDAALTLRNSVVRANRDQGVRVEQGTGNTTRLGLEGNDVFGNNTGAGRSSGGLFFATSSTLTSFSGNKVHGNMGDQIAFATKPNGLDSWVLRPPSQMCDTAANQVYCYGNGAVGIRIQDSAPAGTRVDARNMGWANQNPMRNRDYDMPNLDVVDTMPACTAVTTCN